MDRKTTIIDDIASLQLGNSQVMKGKGKAKKFMQNSNGPSESPVAPSSQSNEVKKAKAPHKTKTAAAPAAQFYEKNGLKINLFEKGGRKRTCARLAHTLRKKSEDDLLAIVELYAGSAKSQEFKKADLRKQEIAEWIEAKETLALGPHPQSKLVGIEKDEEVEPCGTNQTDKLPEIIEPNRGKKRPSPEEEPLSQPPPKQRKRDKTPEPKAIARPVKHASVTKKQLIGTQKSESAKTTTHSQQTGKTPKKHNAPGPVTASHAAIPNNQNGFTQRNQTTFTPRKQGATMPKKERTATPKKQNNTVPNSRKTITTSKMQPTKPATRIDTPMSEAPEIPSSHIAASRASGLPSNTSQTEEAFMTSIGLFPSDPSTATKVVQLHTQLEHRILTAYQRDTAFPSPPSFHSTSIPHGYRADNNPRLRQPLAPFLKPGRHGVGGDFDDDPDRMTGKGHKYDPVDAAQYQEYMAFKAGLYVRYPTYPRLRQGEKISEEVSRAWQEWQVWYVGFVRKYPGRRGDQWVCGCGKRVSEAAMEWEEGDSEEE